LDVAQAKKRTYEIYLDLVPTRLEAFPGAHALVQACRQAGLRVAVASGTDRVKAMASLQKIGLPEESWDTVVTGEQVRHNKPAPDIFLITALKLSQDPASCVVLEDSVNGIRAAKAAGMRCVAVAQTFPATRLQEADVIRDRLADVKLADLLPDQAGV
jgi:HAD superfamily hydrolase (TIGR01509 family)